MTPNNMIAITITTDADSAFGRALLAALSKVNATESAEAAPAAVVVPTAPAKPAKAKPAPKVEVVAEPAKPAPEAKPEPKQETLPEVAAVTEADLRAAMKATIDAVGYSPVEQVFAKHGAKKMSDLKPAAYPAVIAALAKAREVAQ